MKNQTIEIFLFIDALGWKIVNDHKFMEELFPYRKSSFMQFGYSSSAIPTILSGKTPQDHGHLGLFRFTKKDSPFKLLSFFSFLFKPDFFWNHGRVRNKLSSIIKRIYKFTGYFQLYRMPIWKLKYVDYCEKENLFIANGMKPFDNLHDCLIKTNIPFHISDWHLSDDENFIIAEKEIANGKKFLFVYTASLDSLLHNAVGNFDVIEEKLQKLKVQIESLYNQGIKYAQKVNFTILSDHGMTPLTQTVDIIKEIEKTSLKYGVHYGACYDSTMARFYYISNDSKEIIENIMKKYPGHFLSKEEEIYYGIYREDRLFGNGIFLLDAGIQIVPSDMGNKPLNGMHGFAPEDIHSSAVILSNMPIKENICGVKDYYKFMIERALIL